MRIKCKHCEKLVAIINKAQFHRIREYVFVCRKCYESLSSAFAELNVKDSNYTVKNNDTVLTFKNLFGMR